MSESRRNFYLNQLKSWLEFYQEMGLEGLCLQPNFRKDPPPTYSEPEVFQPESKIVKESAINSYSAERPKSLSLFEDDYSQTSSDDSLEKIRADIGDCQRCK